LSSTIHSNGSVHVLGLGVRFVFQVTLETNHLLRQMDRVFHGETDPRVGEYISSLGPEERSFRELYADGKPREQAYTEIADLILEAARAGEKCAYLAPGNPLFLNSVVLKLRKSAQTEGIPFFVYSGVSSLDMLISDLFLPVQDTGLQCYEATHFVKTKPQIDRRVPLALFQPSVVEASDVRYFQGVFMPGAQLLADTLIAQYGPEQKWFLLRSALSGDEPPIVFSGALSELVAKASCLEFGTLLIPGEWPIDLSLD